MLAAFLRSTVKGAGLAAGASIFVAFTVLVAQSLSSFNSGDLVSASQLNANFTTLDTKIDTQAAIAAPAGAIMAFYLAACPNGWIQADGNNSTPDLRGAFVRGMNSFDGGATSNARDPQDTGARTLGHYQTDALQGHRHSVIGYGSGGHVVIPNAGGKAVSDVDTGPDATGSPIAHVHGTPRLSTETRPGNVALIYCMRQ